MPSSHAPIKKYNYERSLFRWVMSRHPEPFEKHGITTRTLERAPLAREAFYTSDWPGARALVQSNDESKYERTAFFDAIIERGLRNGTRFSIEHVTNEEKSRLGITMDRASGKYYLAAYGSPKARRGSSRRGSQTSSDGEAPDLPHMVIKEVEEILTSEIEAAGEHADVTLRRSEEPGPTRGSKVLHFSVSIRRRGSGAGGVESGREKGEGAGAGPPLTQAADAGAGKTTAILGGGSGCGSGLGSSGSGGGGGMPSRRRSGSSTGDGAVRLGREGASSRQGDGPDTTPVSSKSRGRPPLASTSESGGEFPAQPSPSKKRKSVTAAVFDSSRLGVAASEQNTPGLGTSVEAVMRFQRPADVTARSPESDIKPSARLHNSIPHSQVFSTTSTSCAPQFGTSTARLQEVSGNGFPSWSSTYAAQRNGSRMASSGHIQQAQTATSGGNPGAVLPSPPVPSWHVHHSQVTRSDEFGQIGARPGMGRTGESGASDTGATTTTTLTCESLTSASQQHHVPSMASFVRPSLSSTTGRMSPTTMVVPDQHTATISGLNAGLNIYSPHVRQSHLPGMGNLHGGMQSSWGTSNRISGALSGGNREAVDEEDIDFLASFF